MIEQDLLHFGYLFVFIGVVFEGDATLLTAAFLARRGHFHLDFVIAAATLGSFAANQTYYEVARRKGEAWISGLPAPRQRIERVRTWAQSYGPLLIVGSRFLFGFRALVPIVCGASGMKPWWFALWNSAGTLLWANAIGAIGFFGVHTLMAMVLDIQRHELIAALVTAVFACGLIAWATRAKDWADILKLTSRNVK